MFIVSKNLSLRRENRKFMNEEKNKMTAQDYIQKLELMPHPEGGYFKRLFGDDESGKKNISTIFYMLNKQDISAFHRLHDMVEIWYHHAGKALNIYVIDPDGALHTHRLAPDGELQVVIQPEQWFAAEIPGKEGFALVGCAVAPAFTFDNFELADKERLMQTYPQHKALIERMCV